MDRKSNFFSSLWLLLSYYSFLLLDCLPGQANLSFRDYWYRAAFFVPFHRQIVLVLFLFGGRAFLVSNLLLYSNPLHFNLFRYGLTSNHLTYIVNYPVDWTCSSSEKLEQFPLELEWNKKQVLELGTVCFNYHFVVADGRETAEHEIDVHNGWSFYKVSSKQHDI